MSNLKIGKVDPFKHARSVLKNSCICGNYLGNCVQFKNTGYICLDCGMEYENINYVSRKEKGCISKEKLRKARKFATLPLTSDIGIRDTVSKTELKDGEPC